MLDALPTGESIDAAPGLAEVGSGPRRVVALAGSPSVRSRSGALLREALALLEPQTSVSTIEIRNLPAAALLHGRANDPALTQAVAQVQAADWLLVATPIYKAAYSGVLKLFLDLLPPDALRGKLVWPLATGGSLAHLLAVDYALRPVLSALGAREVFDTVFATDAQFEPAAPEGWRPNAAVCERLHLALASGLRARAGQAPPGWVPAVQPPPVAVDRSGAVTAAC